MYTGRPTDMPHGGKAMERLYNLNIIQITIFSREIL
jgi:hypothetical protein